MSKLSHTIYLTVIAILGAAVIWLVFEAPMGASNKTEARSTISSIAVLPFVALKSEDSAERAAETVTSMLIESLGNKSHLKVTSEEETQVFDDTSLDIHEIGDKLSVSMILEGSVRITQGRVRVTVQLIDVETDAHLWSKTYDGDIGDLDSISADIDREFSKYIRDQL